MKIYEKLYLFLKKNLSPKSKNYFYFILHFKNNLKINFPKFIFKFLKTNIYDKKKKKIFTLINFGGSTISRGFSMFRTDPEVCNWIDDFDKESTLVDIGANIGLYSLYAAKKGHKVYAFEPESLNFSCLNMNISDNNLNDQIFAYPIAINDEEKLSTLNLSSMNFGGSGNSFDRKITDSGVEFTPIYKQGSVSYSLESICSKLKIVPENIKIDVDGNELKVINGMLNILDDKNLKSICVELNPNFNEHSKVFKILGEYFNNCKKFEWYSGQEVFNYIFKR
jgi:FkbM family methyltransferase